MNLSFYFQNIIAQWLRGVDFPSAPSFIQVGLSSTNPLADGSGITEPAAVDGYARQAIPLSTVTATSSNGVSVFNSASITFGPVANQAWLNVGFVFLMDDANNLLAFGPMNTPRSLPVADTFALDQDAIQLRLDEAFGLFFSTAILNWLRGQAMPTAATSLKLALSSADPLADMSGLAEPSTGDGYLRQEIAFAAPIIVPNEGTVMELALPVIFGPAIITQWPQLTHGAIVDQDDNLLFYGALATPRIVAIGDALPLATPTIKLLIR